MPFCREDLVTCTNTGYIIMSAFHIGMDYSSNSQYITCYTLWQNPCIYDILPLFSRKLGGCEWLFAILRMLIHQEAALTAG